MKGEKKSITIHKELHWKICLFKWEKKENLYEISLIKVRKSLEAVSNIFIFSFSIGGRLKLRNNGRFNPSRNLEKIKF